MLLNGTTKEELDLVELEGILKCISERRKGASTSPSINLCKNYKLASIFLSSRDYNELQKPGYNKPCVKLQI